MEQVFLEKTEGDWSVGTLQHNVILEEMMSSCFVFMIINQNNGVFFHVIQ
jgi:hypothetical protein